MRRCAASLIVLAALGAAGCSQNEAGRKAIAEQCVKGGDTAEVCDCLAKTSADRLDPELFDLVVLGAKGDDLQAAQRMDQLSPELEARFTTLVPEIMKTCGAEGYPGAS